MTLQEIRIMVLENVGMGEIASTAPIDRIVNRAVEHVVNLVELSAKAYNVGATALTVSVVSGTDKYQLAASGLMRKLVRIVRTDSDREQDVRVIPFAHLPRYQSVSGSRDTYEYRRWGTGIFVAITRERTGIWYVHFPKNSATEMTLSAYVAPPINVLGDRADVPTEVPVEYHEIIVARATLLFAQQRPKLAKSIRTWQDYYAELRSVMEQGLETWDASGPTVRQFHVSTK